jgi:ParB family transcriptional regulator, chromosome partitioning protein
MRSALGKGLDALISDEKTAAAKSSDSPSSAVAEIAISRISPNPKQPRRVYAEQALKELAESIQQRGVLQPILVTPSGDGNYEIIAGERRWRAAQRAGLSTIPAVVKSGPEGERFEIALIENLQREDLSALEQAEGFLRLANEFRMTQEEIAKKIGKDRTVVANTLRLLNLPPAMKAALEEGKMSASHGRALAALEDAGARDDLFKRILEDRLSVRAVEEAVRAHKQKVPVRGHVRGAAPAKAPEVKAIEEDLQRTLARKVELQAGASAKKGWLKLEFYSLDDLDRLIAQLKRVSTQS